jgi:hypothetical protein
VDGSLLNFDQQALPYFLGKKAKPKVRKSNNHSKLITSKHTFIFLSNNFFGRAFLICNKF